MKHRSRNRNDQARAGQSEPAGHHDRHAGHDKHAGHSPGMFRDLFGFSLLLTIPTLVWSEMLQRMLGYAAPAFPGSTYVPAVFGTAVFLYGGRPFVRGGFRELRDRRPGMMTLITLATGVAFVFSVAVTFGLGGEPLWWELASLVTIMLLGHWLEMRSVAQASGALRELARLLPDIATRITGDQSETIPVDQLSANDLILIRPGEGVPADGVVRSGRSDINESMITGESRPVPKSAGDEVIAGTVNGTGSLRVAVTRTGANTALAGIMRLVEQAQTSRSRAQALADRAAFALTLVAILAGTLTLGLWLALGQSPAFAIERTVTVLVIACPHALGLAIPLVLAISTSLGASSGLLVRDRRGLEEARKLDTIAFDKTGTLTRGEFRVVDITALEGLDENQALRIAAAAERDSEHTLARGIVASATDRGLDLPTPTAFQAIPGHGITAIVEGRHLHVGGPALLRSLGLTPPPTLQAAAERAAGRGESAIHLIVDARPAAVFAVADAIRVESRDAVHTLQRQNIRVVMLTGDATPVAAAVAQDLGIQDFFAETLPGQKADRIRELQQGGRRVAMVGDGVNDAPALLTADVGIAIGAGTSVAVEAGDIVLVRNDPRDVPRILNLSRATYRKMLQNLWWAAGYNIVAIPLAAGVLQPIGLLLHPAFGAVLMSASTLIVALNAQLLRRVRL